MKRITRFFTLGIVALFTLFGLLIGSVRGAWHYAMNAVGDIVVPISVEVFPWKGVDQLPSDILGENHQALIEAILNGVYTDANGNVTQIGLNNPDSYISNEIASRSNNNYLFRSDLLGSMDFWERRDIEKFFDTNTSGLTFLLHFPKDQPDTYYLYTTSIELGESTPNIPIGETVYPVYRTTLTKDDEGKWIATETKTGYTESVYYQNPLTGSYLLKYPSIDPDSWTEGDLGTTMNDAVYAYIGQTATAYNPSTGVPKYYKVTATANNQDITVSAEDNAHIIRVYDTNGNLVSTRGNTQQGTSTVTFRGSRNTTYYIEVSGGVSVTFTVSA